MIPFKQYHNLRENSATSIWLDDVRPMQPGYDVHVKTAREAINLLKSNDIKSISFDHDLGPEEAGTGYDVAKWIERAAFDGKIRQLSWSIHSANPVGKKNIHDTMMSAERFWNERENL